MDTGETGRFYPRRSPRESVAPKGRTVARARTLSILRTLLDNELNPLRRDLQQAADMAWPHRVEANPAQRKAYGFQADRPLA
jgi:hypothetical protein